MCVTQPKEHDPKRTPEPGLDLTVEMTGLGYNMQPWRIFAMGLFEQLVVVIQKKKGVRGHD